FTSGMERGSSTHDCTTLGGNSGSVLLDLENGVAVGLHYAGLYQENNFAVPASVLTEYVRGKRWTLPPNIETRPRPSTPPPAPHPRCGGARRRGRHPPSAWPVPSPVDP